VQWALADEYDVTALERSQLVCDEADEEVKRRLEKKALFNKYMEKAGVAPGGSSAAFGSPQGGEPS